MLSRAFRQFGLVFHWSNPAYHRRKCPVGGTSMIIDGDDFGSVEDFRSKYDNALQRHMDQELELVS